MRARTFAAAAAFTVSACLGLPSLAFAQQYLPAASAQGASGIEGAGSGLQRARTRVRVGLELRVDESPEDAIAGAVLVDVEPRAAFGAEIRYVRAVTPNLAIGGGAIGYFAPALLLGPSVGVEARIPIGKKTYFAIGPDVAVFALGSDLPDNTVIWQALLQGGIRVDL